MKTCTHCHADNKDDAKFCVKCGKSFNSTSDKSAIGMTLAIIGFIIFLIILFFYVGSWLFEAYESSGVIGVIALIAAGIFLVYTQQKK